MDNRSVDYLRKAPEKWSPEIPWAGRGRNFQAFELGWDVENDSPGFEKDYLMLLNF